MSATPHPFYAEALVDLASVRDVLRWALSQFHRHELSFGHGSDNPSDEAIYLLLHTLNLPLDTALDPFLDAKLTQSEKRAFLELIRRRCEERLPAS